MVLYCGWDVYGYIKSTETFIPCGTLDLFYCFFILTYHSHCPGRSIHRRVRLHCWSAESCDPASWPPHLWPPRHSFEPEVAPWRCSTSFGPLGPAGGCRKRAVPPLWRNDKKQKRCHWFKRLWPYRCCLCGNPISYFMITEPLLYIGCHPKCNLTPSAGALSLLSAARSYNKCPSKWLDERHRLSFEIYYFCCNENNSMWRTIKAQMLFKVVWLLENLLPCNFSTLTTLPHCDGVIIITWKYIYFLWNKQPATLCQLVDSRQASRPRKVGCGVCGQQPSTANDNLYAFFLKLSCPAGD